MVIFLINKKYLLPKLPSGIYLIQVVQGNNEAQSILQISDIAIPGRNNLP